MTVAGWHAIIEQYIEVFVSAMADLKTSNLRDAVDTDAAGHVFLQRNPDGQVVGARVTFQSRADDERKHQVP